MDQLGINSGVAVIPGARINFAEIEGLLVSMTEEKRAGWQVEHDLYALLSKSHFQQLPESYAIEPAVRFGYEVWCAAILSMSAVIDFTKRVSYNYVK